MRRPLALAVVAVLVGAVLLAPTSAAAADLPPKIDPVYDLPSTWPGGTLTPEEALLRKHEIDLARSQSSMKWWTRPVNLTTTRGLGGALGWAGSALSVGFGLGAQGVESFAVFQASLDPNAQMPDWYCTGTPKWYQESTVAAVVSGTTLCPDIAYAAPNSDQTPGLSALSYLGFNVGSPRVSNSGSPVNTRQYYWCYSSSGTVPAGYEVVLWDKKLGAWILGGLGGPGGIAFCGANERWTSRLAGGDPDTYGYRANEPKRFGLRETATATMVASMVESSGDPTRQTRCTYRFSGGTSKSSDWVNFKDSTGFPTAAWGAACDTLGRTLTANEASTLTSVDVEERVEGGSTHTIASSEVPPELDTKRPDMVGGRKALTLQRTLTGGELVRCLERGDECRDWWEETNQGTTPGAYRCLYGGLEVALTECSVYRDSFRHGTQNPTITDPVTGETIDWGGDPRGSIGPGTGPTPGEQCMATWGSAANPIEWVMRPVQCALVWAFVPRAEKMTQAQTTAQSTFNASLPGRLAGALGMVSPALLALHNGECGGLILPTPDIGAGWSVVVEDRAFLAACPGDFFAPFAPWFFWFITGSIGIAGFFAIRRYLDKFVGNT